MESLWGTVRRQKSGARRPHLRKQYPIESRQHGWCILATQKGRRVGRGAQKSQVSLSSPGQIYTQKIYDDKLRQSRVRSLLLLRLADRSGVSSMTRSSLLYGMMLVLELRTLWASELYESGHVSAPIHQIIYCAFWTKPLCPGVKEALDLLA
jgi:hypothetical protein